MTTPPSRVESSDYVELRTCSAFSFLTGASNPEGLIERAADQGHGVLALADRDGVYGIPRFHQAAKRAGLRAIHGAELTLDVHTGDGPRAARRRATGERDPSLTLLAESPAGWRSLCRLTSLAHAGRKKDEAALSFADLEHEARDLTVLVRGNAGLDPGLLDRVRAIFPGAEQLFVDVTRSLDRSRERTTRRAVDLATAARVPVVATGDVRCARPEDRVLLDALTCLYWRTSLDQAGRRLLPNGEHYLRTPEDMAARFADRPEWVRATRTIADRCAFTLENLGYRFPTYPVPPGETQASFLHKLTWIGARERYGASTQNARISRRARTQIEHELAVIEKLGLCGYFLIVYDISRFALEREMLCQGRGSAANSAVCYALGITAVDPVGMELLFERFLSEERGEWPDIDLDLPSGDQRELAIQYVFEKYGEHGAAMTANVITYRARMAVREMGKALGLANDVIDRLSKLLAQVSFRDDSFGNPGDSLTNTLRDSGVDPAAPRIALLLDLVTRVQGLPRHLGQHSGGIVIAAGRLDEVVPIEPASMEDRRVVQWDKEDCADLGIIKIDLLGLGMLDALEKAIPLIEQHEGRTIDLAHLPPDDPDTYAMIQRADTVGTFQIESRAQMATLPRLKPACFYDLVVEIAIIRPGPIVGEMVHPYLNRRAGREPIDYPHPSLEPILKRTLGVPIFQEQILRIAMEAAGFSGGEAEELRRAMGFKRSVDAMERIEDRLRAGMRAKGLTVAAQESVHRYITAFALYGFPESHSASFALIAYASAYLKCHHPAAFLAGLLNAWPMGFYSPATLVKDAQRHGVEVRPIDVTRSEWACTLEKTLENEGGGRPAVRIGLCFTNGLREETGEGIAAARAQRPFRDLADLSARVRFHRDELDTLAELGALAPLAGAGRREAIWQVAALERDPRSLFSGRPLASTLSGRPLVGRSGRDPGAPSPLAETTPLQDTLTDYRLTGLTTGPQLFEHLRPQLEHRGIMSARALRDVPNGRFVRAAGHVIVRQRPGSGKVCFVTLEDETGTANAILMPDVFKKYRAVLHTSPVLQIEGPLQNVDGVIHVQAKHLEAVPLAGPDLPGSHDYF